MNHFFIVSFLAILGIFQATSLDAMKRRRSGDSDQAQRDQRNHNHPFIAHQQQVLNYQVNQQVHFVQQQQRVQQQQQLARTPQQQQVLQSIQQHLQQFLQHNNNNQ